MVTTTSVLIVGGGLNGLAAAALLAHQGVDAMVVERHSDTSIQYKFAGISPRSMEIFRGLGLEGEIRATRTGDQQGGDIARAAHLADPDVRWGGPAWPDARPYSPTQPATCDQHVLEPILRRCAERLGARIRFSTEFEGFEQDAQQVRARICSRDTGEHDTVVAEYLIAADGARGTLREQLGIERRGPGVLQHWMNLVFDTDLPPTLNGKRFTSCFVSDLNATFTPRDGGRWLLALQYFPEKGELPADFDRARCRALVARGAGRTDVKAMLVEARDWEVTACVADRFREGRCFLIGDAAHLMPPTGAFGGNSGIHDAHNLAWKLALVIRGGADARILESYDQERRPVTTATLAQALARLQKWFADPARRLPAPAPIVDDYDVVFGQRYDDGILVPEGTALERAFEPVAALSGRPGTRAPHLSLERGGEPLSVLDLFGAGFVLLCSDAAWSYACASVGKQFRYSLVCHSLGPGGDLRDLEGRWPNAYGVGPRGAVLVRPDGFVAWRSADGAPDALAQLSGVFGRLGLRTRSRSGSGQ
jgi:putative polyketide hydroxylase